MARQTTSQPKEMKNNPPKPKRPVTGFNFYSKDIRKHIKKEFDPEVKLLFLKINYFLI